MFTRVFFTNTRFSIMILDTEEILNTKTILNTTDNRVAQLEEHSSRYARDVCSIPTEDLKGGIKFENVCNVE